MNDTQRRIEQALSLRDPQRESLNILAHAAFDDYFKKPAVVRRTNFNKNQFNSEMLEELKIKDGLKVHEILKAELGLPSEKSFIYTTTMSMQETSLSALAEEVDDNNLLICCSAFRGNTDAYSNISVKKITVDILKKCEWDATGYPSQLKDYPPKAEDFKFNKEE